MNRPARKYPLTLPRLETHMEYRPTPRTEVKTVSHDLTLA